MIPFEEGYNRRNGLQEPDIKTIQPEMRFQQVEKIAIPSSRELAQIDVETSETLETKTSTVPTTPIAYVPPHDPRNQLSSLVKNAQTNKEALQLRSKRVMHSKERSRREYGW